MKVDKTQAVRAAELEAFRSADECWGDRTSLFWEQHWCSVFVQEYLRLVTPNGLAKELQP